MQGLIDILMLDTPEVFTVDVDADPPLVAVNWPAAPNTFYGHFESPNGNQDFQHKDNLVLLSIGWVLPYCFNIATGSPFIGLSWDEGAGTDYAVPEISQSGGLHIPYQGVEIPMGLFIEKSPTGIGGAVPASLAVTIGAINISMIGVPAILDEDEIPIQLMIKVHHNLPLV